MKERNKETKKERYKETKKEKIIISYSTNISTHGKII